MLVPVALLLWCLFLSELKSLVIAQEDPQSESLPRVLVYSATAGFRHDSIPTALNSLMNEASSINVTFYATEDQSQFRDPNLRLYDAVLMLSTTGEVLDEEGKQAFQSYLDNGGNFIAIHAASDCLINDDFYRRQVGAYFSYHPEITDAIVNVLDSTHPSTSSLPSQWRVRDEMYNFKSNPRDVGATVILSADESSYNDDNSTSRALQGTPHPTAWYQERGAGVSPGGIAGRSFYTSLGHLNETWEDPVFLAHILGGISWVLQSNTTRANNSSAPVGNSPGDNSDDVPTEQPSELPNSSSDFVTPSLIFITILAVFGSWHVVNPR